MKTSSKSPSNPPGIPNMKTLLIGADDKGGVSKSASNAAIADALRAVGYSVKTFDADPINQTLSEIDPSATPVLTNDEEALDDFMSYVPSIEEDIAILDQPGSSGAVMAAYFRPKGLEVFREMGIRVVIAPVVVEHADAIRGILPWVEAFQKKAAFLVIASERDSKGTFDLNSIQHGAVLAKIAENRVVRIPKFSAVMLKHYNRAMGTPSDYFTGGRRAIELGLSKHHSVSWQTHQARVISNLAPFAEWLVGKPIPNPDAVRITPETTPTASGWDAIAAQLSQGEE